MKHKGYTYILIAPVLGLQLFCQDAQPLPLDGTQPLGFLTALIAFKATPATPTTPTVPFTGKIIFQTAATTNGNTGATSGADTLCNADANKPNASAYKALLSDAVGSRTACTTANCGGGVGENFDWPLAASTSYYRSDKTTLLFTTNASGIFVFGTMANSFGTAGPFFWTGLIADWTVAANDCSNWTDGTIFSNGAAGQNSVTGSGAIFVGNVACNAPKTLLCVEQ